MKAASLPLTSASRMSSMGIFGLLSLALYCNFANAEEVKTKEDMAKVCKASNRSEGVDLLEHWQGNFFSISYSMDLNISSICKLTNLRFPSNDSLQYSALTESGYKQIALYNLTDSYYERTMDAKDVKSDKAKLHLFSARGPPYGDIVENLIFGLDCKSNGTVEFFINVGDGDREEQQGAVDRAGFLAVDVTQCSAEWTEIQPNIDD